MLIANVFLNQTLLTFLPWKRQTWMSALCETNLNDSIHSDTFSVIGYLPLIQNDSSTHMHAHAVDVREGLLFAKDLPWENSTGFTSVSYFFFLYWSPSSYLCTIFDSISSNIDEVLSINPSANLSVFGHFIVHHKDWLTYSGGLIDLVNSVIRFLSQMTLLRWLAFLDPRLWFS